MDEVDFGAIFDALPNPTAVLTRDGFFMTVNRAYEEVSGRPRASLIGANIYETFPGSPEDQGAALLRISLERVVTQGRVEVMPLLRYDVESPDGVVEERYWSLMNAPVFGPDGTVRYVIHRVEEATAFVGQVRAHSKAPVRSDSLFTLEARLQVIEADLFARTAELQADNLRLHGVHERDTAALRLAMERQRNAVTDTSHDLRGPITGLQLRLQGALEDPTADAHDVLRAALLDAERLGDIVGDLLELARLDAGTPAHTEPVDLSETVAASLKRHAMTALTIDARLSEAVVVNGSPVRLMRVVDNLLTNAERHARTRIEVRVQVEAEDAVLRVRDDGLGIPEQDREAVFERFFRRADARKADPKGTGLGLAISREIAHSHGGTLHVADDHPGAHFVLRLPRWPSPAAAERPARSRSV